MAEVEKAANGVGQRLGPVSEKHRFDESALDRWMSANVDGYAGSLEVRQFAGGASNPTFLLTSGDHRYVLRKKPPGQLLQSAHQVDREYRVMKALGETGVPVPVMRGICDDPEVIGTSFYVMDFLEGRIFRDASLPGMSPDERAAIYDELNATLAKLHVVDWRAVGLEGFGKPGNYFERQVARWARQYRDAPLDPVPAMDQLIEELPDHIPDDDSVSIAHGDYRLENVMFHPTEPKLVAVLDWELSTIGHPLADLGYSGFLWHSHSPVWGSLDGVDLETSGIPTEAEWVEAYRRRTGRDEIVGWNFLLAFSVFRLASISHGVHARALAGITPTGEVGENGCPILAEQALELLHKGDAR
ncbi:phosphotransferase family protein [Pacificimonas flava]|uniref:Phosphotransferase family protein n=2 Tax=Pacificimonas TaxID=1960290 RepID=A0A219B2S6_9SPHN|nr:MULTISPECIES: phosphotransferase family protein [Pacificimonas]MBZ6377864.1 phosphotransferase family protein [Pacificimonas aurantium]OWV32474.1 phosphotransferase family protein [Pacificimonas flava]